MRRAVARLRGAALLGTASPYLLGFGWGWIFIRRLRRLTQIGRDGYAEWEKLDDKWKVEGPKVAAKQVGRRRPD